MCTCTMYLVAVVYMFMYIHYTVEVIVLAGSDSGHSSGKNNSVLMVAYLIEYLYLLQCH